MILKWLNNLLILNKPLFIMTALFVFNIVGCVNQKTYIGSDRPVVERKLDPIDAAKNRVALGLTYLQKGNTTQAKFNLEKALEFAPNLAEANYSLAYYYQTVNNLEKAEYYYEKVISLDKQNGDALNNYGAFLCEHGQIEKAQSMFLRAVELDSYIRVAQTYENLGLCLYGSDQPVYHQQAERYLIKALGYNKSLAKSLEVLTEINQNRQDWSVAWQYYKQLEIITKPSAQLYWVGYQLAKEQGDLKTATFYGRKLLVNFPNSQQAQLYKEYLLR